MIGKDDWKSAALRRQLVNLEKKQELWTPRHIDGVSPAFCRP
jgi:hypothetical protein